MSRSAALNLRESFGDRKIPDISRKITACVLCRKLKIKCHMNGNRPPCSRCKTRGLACSVNKSLQMLLENDASWKELMEDRMSKLEESVKQNTSQFSDDTPTNAIAFQPPSSSIPRIDIPNASNNTQTPGAFTLNLSCSLGAFPASSMSLTLSDSGANSGKNLDPVSCGIISQSTADTLFAFYKENLDPSIHHALSSNDTLSSTRTSSTLLTSAICAVSANCTGSQYYDTLLNIFKTQVSEKVFSSKHTFDDIRALCIGALWINEISTALNSLAVRIATELDLHRCITKMPHTKRECYDRTRLYWLVYLCDHHNSLIHGRPPLTRDFHSLRRPRDFLQSYYTNPSDLALISQVELWSISSRIFDTFGADIECHAAQRLEELAQLSFAYDQWYEEWFTMLSFANTTNSFLRRAFDLYFHSARLYLFSHVFRGSQDEGLATFNTDIGKFASDAMKCALAVIKTIVDDTESSSCLERLPSYMATMMTFACVCLVKASRQQGPWTLELQNEDIISYLHRLIRVLRSSPIVNPSHPLLSIAKSLEAVTGEEHGHGSLPWSDIRDLDLDMSFFDMFTNGNMC